MPGQQFEYAHDDIGNRRTAKAGGDENGANLRSASYTPNSLNQYTSREVPGAVDVLGLALGDNSSLTVNSAAPWRKGEYFRKEVSVANSSVAVWQAVAVAATGETTVNGNVFVPKTPENYTYDDDGNLTQDGRWDYTWDAENRLVKLVSKSGAPSGSERWAEFTYDGKSRRIGKKVWNNATGTGSPASEEKFLYDGWNLLAVLSSSSQLQSAFVWGLDLSGTLQGAGGVGGLLMFTNSGNGAHFCAYDGNGNVAALVKASDGTVSANYEYGPFGEALRVTGTMGKANPFRFSTKYQDDESDFLYYGYRSYNPGLGRWLSRDPLGESGFHRAHRTKLPSHESPGNCLSFVRNDPVALVDPVGLEDNKSKLAACCLCTPGSVVAAAAIGKRHNVNDATGNVREWILKGNTFADKLEEYFPDSKDIKKVCKQIRDLVGEMNKAAKLAELATIGSLEMWTSTGYPFNFDVTLKFVCCGKNKLPVLPVNELSQQVRGDVEENRDGMYIHYFPGDLEQLGSDITKTINQLFQQAQAQCKAQAQTPPGSKGEDGK